MQDARCNASSNGIDNATFVTMDLATNMPKIDVDLPRPDVVVVGVTASCISRSQSCTGCMTIVGAPQDL